jgi:hypothetical protein
MLDSKNAIQRESLRWPRLDCYFVEEGLSVMYITEYAPGSLLRVCFGKVKREACPDQLITFTRCRHKALPIKYRDLPSAARDQTGAFQLTGSIRDGWPLDPQHFGEQVLSNLQRVIVAAVTHHEQPTR